MRVDIFSAAMSETSWKVWLFSEIKEHGWSFPEDNEGNLRENKMRLWRWEGCLCLGAISLRQSCIRPQKWWWQTAHWRPCKVCKWSLLRYVGSGGYLGRTSCALPAGHLHYQPEHLCAWEMSTVPASPVSSSASFKNACFGHLVNTWESLHCFEHKRVTAGTENWQHKKFGQTTSWSYLNLWNEGVDLWKVNWVKGKQLWWVSSF